MSQSTTLQRYQPSGFFRPTTFALFLGAMVGGILVAWVYQLLMRWIPFIYLNAIICAGFGGLLGAAGAWAVKTGHCRNRIIAVVLALPLVAVSLGASYWWSYRSWIGEATEELQKEHPGITEDQIKELAPFSKYIDVRVDDGWSVSSHGGSGSKMNGAMVYIVWSIEALILLGIAGALIWAAVTAPYCERCNQWGNERKMILHGLRRVDADPLIQSGDLDSLIGLPLPAEPDVRVALAMTATLCPTCKETGFLTVEEKQVVAQKKGKPQEKTVSLVSNAILRADQRQKFLDRLEPPAAPPAAAAL